MSACLGYQSEDRKAICCTSLTPLFWGRVMATTKLYRRQPSGTPDLIAPLVIKTLLWATVGDARRMHMATWLAYRNGALDPVVQEAIAAGGENTLLHARYMAWRTTPN